MTEAESKVRAEIFEHLVKLPPSVAALVTLAMKWGPYDGHKLRDTTVLAALRDLKAWKDQE